MGSSNSLAMALTHALFIVSHAPIYTAYYIVKLYTNKINHDSSFVTYL